MTVSKAQIKATNKYNNKVYDRIVLVPTKLDGQKIRAAAAAAGLSVNAFCLDAIREKMRGDAPPLEDDPAVDS